MRNTRVMVLVAFGLLAFSITASATPCANQNVTAGLVCTLQAPSAPELTFTFEAVNFSGPNSSLDSISFETPTTGVTLGSDISYTLDFQVVATYPVDIHLIYGVASTAKDIVALDSSFTPASGPPPPQINESACGSDPVTNPPCNPVLANVINSTGSETFTAAFGAVQQLWVDKDITDPGFSSFTDSVEIPEGRSGPPPVPEPASLSLFGCSLLGFGFALHRLRTKAE
jgi:hypothetical protein